MDHHCPWTINCVSHRTFPHFFRFLFYAVMSTTYVEYLLYVRAEFLWTRRNLPSVGPTRTPDEDDVNFSPQHLGPSAIHMALLFTLITTNSVTLFALGILLLRNMWSLGSNVTTIESWEIARHENLIRRARLSGGYLNGPDGIQMRITRQEFPYDIGILQNICQGMGDDGFFWLWPFAATPSNASGLQFETNGFEGVNDVTSV
jgi:palmitoyltransferase